MGGERGRGEREKRGIGREREMGESEEAGPAAPGAPGQQRRAQPIEWMCYCVLRAVRCCS